MTSLKGYGVCVTEGQAVNLSSTLHLLFSCIVHLLYTGIQLILQLCPGVVSRYPTPKS